MPKSSNEPMDEDDMLLAEAKNLGQKIQKRHRRESNVAQLKDGKTTPIKEEDMEEDFDDSGTNSKTTGGQFGIEEARNYDSNVSGSKSKQSPTRTENSDSMGVVTGVQGSLNVFKQSFNQSLASEKSSKTPFLGERFQSSSPTKVANIPED